MSDSGGSPVAIVGLALEFSGITEPADFHDRVMTGARMFRREGHEADEAEQTALAERTAARALADAGPRAGGLRTGKLITRNPSCSLRAIATACDTIVRAEYDLVLAGGVSLGVDPEWTEFHRRNQTTPPAEMRPYDARPAGSLPGEGCGVLALMALPVARANGLEVYAEIAAWSAPEGGVEPGERIRGAYQRAGLMPSLVQYLEGHGAATNAGDQAELELLLDVYSSVARSRNCALGAVSGCIGDARAASGVASLIKSVLAMASGTIPPVVGNQQPHHLLEKETTPFWLPRSAVPWPDEGPKLAAINAMASGPVHLVLRREPEPPRSAGRRRRPAAAPRESAAGLIPRPRTSGEPPRLPAPRPSLDLAGPPTGHDPVPGGQAPSPTGQAGSSGEPPRPPVIPKPPVLIALDGTDQTDLAAALDTIAIMATRLSSTDLHEFARQLAADLASAKSAPGQLRAAILAEEPPQLAERARRAAEVTRTTTITGVHAGPGLYLSNGAAGRVTVLLAGLPDTPLAHTEFFAACLATLDWLTAEGVTPEAVAGFGAGEIMALAWAGSLTMADAAHLMGRRAQIVAAIPRQLGTRTRRQEESLGPAMRAAATAVRFGPPLRRVISAAAGRELTASDDLLALLAGSLGAPANPAGALGATTDLIIAPHGYASAVPGPAVAAPDQRVPASVTTARAALFAAGAITKLSP